MFSCNPLFKIQIAKDSENVSSEPSCSRYVNYLAEVFISRSNEINECIIQICGLYEMMEIFKLHL